MAHVRRVVVGTKSTGRRDDQKLLNIEVVLVLVQRSFELFPEKSEAENAGRASLLIPDGAELCAPTRAQQQQ